MSNPANADRKYVVSGVITIPFSFTVRAADFAAAQTDVEVAPLSELVANGARGIDVATMPHGWTIEVDRVRRTR